MRRISLGKWVALGLLILPTAEIGVFILVTQWLGLEGAFLLLLATTLLGIGVLRYVGRVVIQRFVRLMAERNAAAIEVGSAGLLTVLGGILLVLPGFLTDAIGLALILPPARRWIAGHFDTATAARPADGVVNLDAAEWRRMPEARLEPRKDEP
jgi:UPF0716 protein FxsA